MNFTLLIENLTKADWKPAKEITKQPEIAKDDDDGPPPPPWPGPPPPPLLPDGPPFGFLGSLVVRLMKGGLVTVVVVV